MACTKEFPIPSLILYYLCLDWLIQSYRRTCPQCGVSARPSWQHRELKQQFRHCQAISWHPFWKNTTTMKYIPAVNHPSMHHNDNNNYNINYNCTNIDNGWSISSWHKHYYYADHYYRFLIMIITIHSSMDI